jgi:hypothetical protein
MPNICPVVGGRYGVDFISEDDLNTFDGYLRLQVVDPSTAGPDVHALL